MQQFLNCLTHNPAIFYGSSVKIRFYRAAGKVLLRETSYEALLQATASYTLTIIEEEPFLKWQTDRLNRLLQLKKPALPISCPISSEKIKNVQLKTQSKTTWWIRLNYNILKKP